MGEQHERSVVKRLNEILPEVLEYLHEVHQPVVADEERSVRVVEPDHVCRCGRPALTDGSCLECRPRCECGQALLLLRPGRVQCERCRVADLRAAATVQLPNQTGKLA